MNKEQGTRNKGVESMYSTFQMLQSRVHIHSTYGFYSPSPLGKSGLKLGCNYIIYGNLKSEISAKLYIMNSASGQIFYIHDGMYARKWSLPLTKYVHCTVYCTLGSYKDARGNGFVYIELLHIETQIRIKHAWEYNFFEEIKKNPTNSILPQTTMLLATMRI